MKNPRVCRRKENLKIRAEISAKKTKQTNKRDHTKRRFFVKISKIDKPLARFLKKKREKNQTNKIKNEMEKSHRNTKDHKRLLSATICQ